MSGGSTRAKDLVNWRQGVDDEFAERSVGLAIGNVFGPLHLVGLAIAAVGIVSGVV